MHPNSPNGYEGGDDFGLKPFGLPPQPPDKFCETGVGKGAIYKLSALHGTLFEVMGLCIFYAWGTAENCLTPKRLASIYSTLTGWDVDQFALMKTAERVWNLKRCYNYREGATRQDDTLPKRMFQPLTTGPSKGRAVQNLKGMLKEYYEASGWDVETGIPSKEQLRELGLDDVAAYIEKHS